jgi:hypothetical protein
MFMQPQVQVSLLLQSKEMTEIDTIIDRAVTSGDPLIATDHGNQLGRSIALKGVALAKLFFGMRSNWELFRAAGIEEEFGDFVNAHMTTITSKVAEKYADMYEAVLANADIPLQIRDQLAGKPIKQLLLLTAAVREGDLDEDDLEDVVVLDYNGVRQKVRDARGDVTSSRRTITARLVQREESKYPHGSLVVFGADEQEVIGQFKLIPETETGRIYLERIKNQLGWEDIR